MHLPLNHEAMLDRRIIKHDTNHVVIEETWDFLSPLCPFILSTSGAVLEKDKLSLELDNEPVPTDKPSIQEGYPPERHYIEMTLVRMMHGRMSWADYCDINQALNNIRMHAEDMDRERRVFMDDGCNTCEPQRE